MSVQAGEMATLGKCFLYMPEDLSLDAHVKDRQSHMCIISVWEVVDQQ